MHFSIADDRLESIEATGAESNMHTISRVKEIELELLETLVISSVRVRVLARA